MSARVWWRPRVAVLALCVAAVWWIMPHLERQKMASTPYHEFFIVGGPVQKGDYVDVELRHPLINPRAPERLTKRIVCVAGDELRFRDGQHFCNGIYLGRVVAKTLRGEPLAPFAWNGPIPSGKVFLMGTNARSFDSRYFGFVDESRVRKVWPLF